MNMKTNFTNQSHIFIPCARCKEGMVHVYKDEKFCFECKEELKIKKFLAPFPPEGQKLDEHLFPVTSNVLPLTM